MRKIGRYDVAAAIAFVAASLVGCTGDDPEPKISPSAAPSSSANPSPTSASATPEVETPEAFIRRWNELSTEMQNTGEPATFRSVNDPACTPCTNLIELVTGYYEAGGYVRATTWAIESIKRRPGSPPEEPTFDVAFTAEPTEYKKSADAKIERTSGGANTLAMTLRRSGDTWMVTNYLVAAS